MKKRLTFIQLSNLLVLNTEFEKTIKKNAQKIYNQLAQAKNPSKPIEELMQVLDDLINFDLIDAIWNASEDE